MADKIEEVKDIPKVVEEVKDIPKVVEKDVPADVFELLFKDKDKEIRVLNVIGGCVINTYFKSSVASIFIAGSHIKDGKIGPM